MQVKPLGKRVLIKVSPAEEKTSSGIIIPAAAQEKTNQGIVIATGNSSEGLKVNDKIIYDKYAGTQIKLNGEEHILMSFEDVLAVVE